MRELIKNWNTKQGKESELIHINDALHANNYPQNVFQTLKKKSSNQRTNPIPSPEEPVYMFFKWAIASDSFSFAVFPKINGISQPLTRLFNSSWQ